MLNGCFPRKRSFKLHRNSKNDRQLAAMSGRMAPAVKKSVNLCNRLQLPAGFQRPHTLKLRRHVNNDFKELL